MKYLGCAYYPEYWGVDRLKIDAPLMRVAGINLVRIGEFAWSRMEPREGHYTLDWLHQTADVMKAHGIDVMMCTPTPTPPAWLTQKHPEICVTKPSGLRVLHGSRRHACSTIPVYRQHSARIAEKLATEMRSHSNVIAWQIDNELGPESGWCYCDNCQSEFRKWLQARYETIEGVNEAWKTGFWSVDYNDFSQIRLADDNHEPYSSRKLDSRRFWSDMMIAYGLSQADVLRKAHPGAIVTTNGMGPIFPPLDYYKLFGPLDVACDDLYFDIATQDASACAMSLYRSYKPGKPFWLTETGSGALTHEKPPLPEQFRAWVYSNYAFGGEAHVVFRWRTCLSGHEQELQGILEHSGKPRHRYDAVKKAFLEVRDVAKKLGDLPLPKADVAIVHDYQSLWAYESSRINGEVNIVAYMLALHKSFYAQNILTDFVPPGRDLLSYKLVVLPTTVIVSQELIATLKAFVNAGGTVLAMGQLGMRDENNNYLIDPPEGLKELFGVTIEGGMYLMSAVGPDESLWTPGPNKHKVALSMVSVDSETQASGTADVWAADVVAHDADVIMKFDADVYKGQPAIVQKKVGKGTTMFVGAIGVDAATQTRIIHRALQIAGVESGPVTPLYVEVVRRGDITFAINHTAHSTHVELPSAHTAVLGEITGQVAYLPPHGVGVYRATSR